MFIDVYSMSINNRLKVFDIPKEITLAWINKRYKLEGIVSFKDPYTKTRRLRLPEELKDIIVHSSDIGHYTAVILHENGKWTEINDLCPSEGFLKDKSVVPHLLVYSEK